MKLRMLTEEERIHARERARQLVEMSNRKPTREQFANTTISRYPAWFTRMVAGMMVIVLVAAALPSLFRLFTAGAEYFMHGIDNRLLASTVGVSTFLLAEFLIILSTISARVYFTGRERWIFVLPVVMGLSMALVGNWVVAQPTDVFGWLETLIPPLAVLFIAFIGERLVLDAVETRHASEMAYQSALSEWQRATAKPESSPEWRSAYANALRDALKDANAKGRGSKERIAVMEAMTMRHWAGYVAREMNARDWFDEGAQIEDIDAPEKEANPPENPFGNIPPAWEENGNGTMLVSANGHGGIVTSNGTHKN